jgi:ABC-type branched-subunit amino acid transport system ATPase component
MASAEALAAISAYSLEPSWDSTHERSCPMSRPEMMGLVFERIRDINRSGVAVLLVEQNAREALRMSHRGYVLVAGENRLDDTGPDLLDNPQVASLYLGG